MEQVPLCMRLAPYANKLIHKLIYYTQTKTNIYTSNTLKHTHMHAQMHTPHMQYNKTQQAII